MRKKIHKNGFTLIELLAVIVILGILCSGYWFFAQGPKQQGVLLRLEADMEALSNAKLRWRLDHPTGEFPVSDGDRYMVLRPYLDPERPVSWEQFPLPGYQYQINALGASPTYTPNPP